MDYLWTVTTSSITFYWDYDELHVGNKESEREKERKMLLQSNYELERH